MIYQVVQVESLSLSACCLLVIPPRRGVEPSDAPGDPLALVPVKSVCLVPVSPAIPWDLVPVEPK